LPNSSLIVTRGDAFHGLTLHNVLNHMIGAAIVWLKKTLYQGRESKAHFQSLTKSASEATND